MPYTQSQLVVASSMLHTCEAKEDKASAAGRTRAQQAKVEHQCKQRRRVLTLMRGFAAG